MTRGLLIGTDYGERSDGYATVSAIGGLANERSKHYGVAPQAALAPRLTFGERASLDLAVREYYVSDVSAGERGGHDNVVRGASECGSSPAL